MISKRTVLHQIEITASGVIQVRFLKQFVDGSTVIGFPDKPYHRTSINPGMDVDTVMAIVNEDLERNDCARVADYQALKEHAAVAHTLERIAAFTNRSET